METATLIDIIATNNQAAISCCDVITSSLSDHDMVGCSRKIHSFKYGPRTIVCRNYAKYDPKEMVKDVKNIDWEPFYQSTCVNSALDYFNTKLRYVFHRHAPTMEKRVKG